MADFVHLHNHTDFSLLDGAQSVTTLIDTIGDLNMASVGITEHGNLFSALKFYKQATAAGVKPIIGSEVYVAKKSRFDKQATQKSGWGYHHLILLAQNNTGYHNLIKLVSAGYLEGFYYRPRVDKDLLRQHSEGLICTSACLKGEVQENAVKGRYEDARAAALEYAEIFPDRYYLELQKHDIPEEDEARKVVKKLARELDLPLVATNDCHYARREHWQAHDIMFCLGTGKDRNDPNRRRYATPEFYFKSADEMYQLFKDTPGALENTLAIAEKCQVGIELGNLHLPRFPIPAEAGTQDPDDYLRKLTYEGIKTRYRDLPEEITQRLDFELAVIKDMQYAGYFLITMDLTRFARTNRIPVGPGRGSAAGSLVAYALGITNIDPIRYNLLFERFLNPDRISMPDIDIDFCQDRRGEMIEYARKRYGEDAVTQIITFGKMKARSAVRDVGRVLGMSFAEVDRIAKMIPDDPKISIEKAMTENPELSQAEELDPVHAELFQYSRVLEGMNRHASTHAAGVVIAPGALTDYIPLYRNPKTGETTTQIDMNDLEELGLLKMDFLGLRTLTVIDHTLKMLRERNIELDVEKIPLDDPLTYELFAKGQTIGVFQFESGGMREFLQKLKPTCIDDLIAMNALYRPGPMNHIDHFIDCKHGRKKLSYLHPVLEPILRETYGIIVYQEQVMQIASVVAGFTLAQADIMRRAMGKKKQKEMKRMEAAFMKGAVERDMPQKSASEIYALVAKFAEYGFNKSHSTAYAILAYQTAYLKVHYPAEFMAANLSSEINNPDRVPILISEAHAMELAVLPPDVNRSGRSFQVNSDGQIVFGLNAIKHVGSKSAEHIQRKRKEKGPWRTLPEFLGDVELSIVNRKAVECLIKSGASDSLEGSRHQRYAMLDDAVRYAQQLQEAASSNQASLFGEGGESTVISEPLLPDVPSWTEQKHLEMEKELTGFYLTGNPLGEFEDDLREFSNYDFMDEETGIKLEQIRTGGIISQVKIHHTRQNRQMAFCTLDGLVGSVEVVVFSDVFEQTRELLMKERRIFVTGRPSTQGNGPFNGQSSDGNGGLKVLAEEIIPLEQLRSRKAKRLNLRLFLNRIESKTIQELYALSDRNRGNCELHIQIHEGEDHFRWIRSTQLRVSPNGEFVTQLRSIIGRENVWLST